MGFDVNAGLRGAAWGSLAGPIGTGAGLLYGGFFGGHKKKYHDPAADARTSWRHLAPPTAGAMQPVAPGAQGAGPQMGAPAPSFGMSQGAMPQTPFDPQPFHPGAGQFHPQQVGFQPPPFPGMPPRGRMLPWSNAGGGNPYGPGGPTTHGLLGDAFSSFIHGGKPYAPPPIDRGGTVGPTIQTIRTNGVG